MSEEAISNNAPAPAPQKILKNWDRRRKIVAIGAVPVLFVFSIIFSIPAVFFIQDPTNIPIQIAIGITLGAEILAIIWAVFFGGLRPIKKYLYLGLKHWWYVPLGLGVGVVSYALLQAVAFGAQAISGEAIQSSETSSQLGGLTGLTGILFLILGAGLLVPFIEEVYFRGVILGALQNSTWNKAWLSVTLSAIFFGIMHIQGFSTLTDIVILVWITILGGVFAALVLWTKSLWTAVAAHVGYNMVTSLIIISGIGA